MSETTVTWHALPGVVRSAGLDALAEARSEGPWVWVDVTHPTPESFGPLIEAFGLHPLAVEDALHVQVRPKVDTFSDAIFFAWLTPLGSAADYAVSELDVFLGKDFIITAHSVDGGISAHLGLDIDDAMSKGPDWLAHALVDRLVDGVLAIVDDLGDSLEGLEDSMLGQPRPQDLEALYRVRRRLVAMHRIVSPERDIVRTLARERDVVGEDAYRYFQDVGDHLARVDDSIETYRDVAAGVMDIYLSAQSNRMNEIMKQLTAVATIFMPLTLLSGIYGMNVVRGMWPPISATWSFGAVVGSMVVIALWMSWYFRRRNWW
jgi:magnesium transporter